MHTKQPPHLKCLKSSFLHAELIRKAKEKVVEKSKANADQPEKQTIFERYGYTIGKDLGSGSYAKVKVSLMEVFLNKCRDSVVSY